MQKKPTKCIDCGAKVSRPTGVTRCRTCWLSNPNIIKGYPNRKPFWDYVKKTDTCWIWIGCLNPQGYGLFRNQGRNRGTHRISWELSNGLIPEGMHVCHKCDNPPCVRPDHLFVGTASDNMKDMGRKGRHSIGDRKGEKHPNAKYTEEQVREVRRLYKPYSHEFNAYKLAQRFGMTRGSVQQIVTGKQWKHI